MNPTKIPNKYKNINFINLIIERKIFIIDWDYLFNLKISETELNLICYIIYEFYNIDIDELYFENTPKDGIEFINKKSNKKLGIYHIHLQNNCVLIWYITNKGQFKIEYIQHPKDDYKYILNNIYNKKDGGFNINNGELFIDDLKILERKLYDFNNFIKNLLN